MRRSDQTSIGGIIATLVIGTLIALAGSSGGVRIGETSVAVGEFAPTVSGGFAVFAIAAIIAFVINWIVFVPSYAARTEAYFDLTGSLTYITVIVVAVLLSDDVDFRGGLVAALVIIWAIRLGSFLFRRIRRDGRDGRFDKIKTNPLRFLMTWSLQGLWVLLTLACALAVITSKERVDTDIFLIVGLVIWVIGFAIEVAADQQKSAFKRDPTNDGSFITTGLWAWSRHPNYFGEITLWIGVAVIALPVLDGWRWFMLISPIFVIVLLTRISGLPMLEARAEKRWGNDSSFRNYTDNTPVLIPRPPR